MSRDVQNVTALLHLTMAAYTTILLVTALCVGTAICLQCYTCTAQTSNTNCLTAANCTNGETYCETSLASVAIGGISASSITKVCAATCTPTSFSLSVASTSVSCCSLDLCNRSGGTSIKSGYTAIILALGSIFTILKSSLV